MATLRIATYNIHKGVQGIGPTRRLEIHNLGHAIEIRVRDNGTGIPDEVKQKMFGLNCAHLYGLDMKVVQGPAFTADKLAAINTSIAANVGEGLWKDVQGAVAQARK